MSYILDALRWLEQDKERSRKGANPMEAVLLPDTEAAPWPKRRKLWWTGLGVVLLVAVIGATSWVTRRTLHTPLEPAVEGTAALLASAPSGPDGSSAPSFPEVPASTSPPLPPEPAGTAVSARTEVAPSKPVEGIPPPVPPPTEEPVQVGDPPTPTAPEEESGPAFLEGEEVPGGTRETMPLELGVSEDEVIPEWEGSEIKINAIAYSQDPGGRFAVVNLKTVHEGQEVGGFSVLAIQENGIVFEGEGRKFRVLLGKP